MSIDPIEVNETIEKEIVNVRSVATGLTIATKEDFIRAGEMLVTIKKVKKAIEDYFRPLKDAAYKSWKQLCDRERAEIDKLTPAINHLNKQMTAWTAEQERIRKAEEEKLRQEILKLEEERRLAEALQAEKEGRTAEAEAILSEPVVVTPVILEKTTPKVAGLTQTTNWKWRVTDESLIPRQFLQIDEAKISRVVRALKGQTNIPGIEVYQEQTMRITK